MNTQHLKEPSFLSSGRHPRSSHMQSSAASQTFGLLVRIDVVCSTHWCCVVCIDVVHEENLHLSDTNWVVTFQDSPRVWEWDYPMYETQVRECLRVRVFPLPMRSTIKYMCTLLELQFKEQVWYFLSKKPAGPSSIPIQSRVLLAAILSWLAAL